MTSPNRAPKETSSHPQILLLYPKTGMDFGSTVAPPHALLAVAAPLVQAGYRVKILDQRIEAITSQVLARYLSPDTIAVGISAMTGSQIHFALLLARRVRDLTKGRIPIVWGGCHPSVMPEQTARHELVDIVVKGEGDLPFLDLVRALEHHEPLAGLSNLAFKDGNQIVQTPDRPLMNIESLLPVPWELIDVEAYIHRDMYLQDRTRVLDIGQTSRGCPFTCGFCSSASIRQRRWRPMSIERTLHMITENVRRFDLDGFWLRDDEFYIDRKRAHTIFEGMVREGLDVGFYTSGTRCDVFGRASDEELTMMKRAGAHTLKFGAESGSQRILDLMQKGIKVEQTIQANERCRKHGITPAFALIVGYPTETFEEMEQTIDLGFRLLAENPEAELESMATYTALPGTPDFQLAIDHGLAPPQSLEEWSEWNFDEYDLEGRRIPWFKTRRERSWVGNISYLSVLANALPNVASSVRHPLLQKLGTAGARAAGAQYRARLKAKRYRFAPDLPLVRFLRKKLFYRSELTMR